VPGRRFGEDLQKQALRQRVEGSPGPEGSPAEVSLIVGAPRWGSRGQGSQVATQTCQVNMGKAWASKIGNDKIILYVFFYIWSMPICEPWCWYIYLQNWVIFTANVGKYSSTMGHMGNVFHYIYGELLECDS
jgi:hypothetical protein